MTTAPLKCINQNCKQQKKKFDIVSFKTNQTKRTIVIGGRDLGTVYHCPNNKDCEENGGFGLCKECRDEATAAAATAKNKGLEIPNANERSTRRNVLSPQSRRGRAKRCNVDHPSGTAALNSNKRMKCCDAHSDIGSLMPLNMKSYCAEKCLEKNANFPPRECHCCKSSFQK